MYGFAGMIGYGFFGSWGGGCGGSGTLIDSTSSFWVTPKNASDVVQTTGYGNILQEPPGMFSPELALALILANFFSLIKS